MSTYPYPASLVYEKLDLNEVTFRSWRNRIGLYTDSRGEYRWGDALRIASLRQLLDQGLAPEHAVGVVNYHRERFATLEECRDTYFLDWRRRTGWSGPLILTGNRLNRAHDRYFGSLGDFVKETLDHGLPPAAMLLDLGRVAQRTVRLFGEPPREDGDA